MKMMQAKEIRIEDKFSLGVRVAGLGLGTIDYIGDTVTLDDRGAHLFDLPANVPIMRADLHSRIHPGDIGEINCQIERLLDTDAEGIIEVTHRVVHTNGDVLWLNAHKQIEFARRPGDDKPLPVSGLVAIIDITAHKQDQQRIQFLMDELNHRSKNLLTVIQSLARTTFSTGDLSTFKERFSGRLQGLAHNHDALVRGNWTKVDLRDLVTSHLAGFVEADSSRVTLDGPPVELVADQAQAIGMALHELATNAAKHGALSVDVGHVHISWRIATAGHLTLSWTESGGPAVSEPETFGFGQKVIKDMTASSLGGTVELLYRPEGLFWQVEFARV